MAANKGEITSSFSQTCRLLSQYLMEKKTSPGNLNCKSLAPKTMSLLPGLEEQEERRPPKSMHLFPQNPSLTSVDGSNAKATTAEEKQQQQLTIFYGGQVLVFDDFPAEKVKNLMEMATEFHSVAPAQNLRLSSAAAGRAPPAANPSDMPRRNSLHRFLEKRKDRISTKAPYGVNGSTVPRSTGETKLEPGPSWLNLGNQAPALVDGLPSCLQN